MRARRYRYVYSITKIGQHLEAHNEFFVMAPPDTQHHPSPLYTQTMCICTMRNWNEKKKGKRFSFTHLPIPILWAYSSYCRQMLAKNSNEKKHEISIGWLNLCFCVSTILISRSAGREKDNFWCFGVNTHGEHWTLERTSVSICGYRHTVRASGNQQHVHSLEQFTENKTHLPIIRSSAAALSHSLSLSTFANRFIHQRSSAGHVCVKFAMKTKASQRRRIAVIGCVEIGNRRMVVKNSFLKLNRFANQRFRFGNIPWANMVRFSNWNILNHIGWDAGSGIPNDSILIRIDLNVRGNSILAAAVADVCLFLLCSQF